MRKIFPKNCFIHFLSPKERLKNPERVSRGHRCILREPNVLSICGTVKVSYVEQSPPPSPSLVEGEVEGGLEGGVGEEVRVGGEGGVEIKPELKIEIVKEVCKEIVQVELTKRPEIVTPAKTETNFYLDTSQMELKKKTETAGFITTEIQVGDDK